MEVWHNYLKALCEKHKQINHQEHHARKLYGPHWEHFVRSGDEPDILVFRHPAVERLHKVGGDTQSRLTAGFSVLLPTTNYSDDVVQKIQTDTREILLQMLAKMKADKKDPEDCNPFLSYFELDEIDIYEDGVHANKYIGMAIRIPIRSSLKIPHKPEVWH